MIKIDEGEFRKLMEEMGVPTAKIDEAIASFPKTQEEEDAQIKEMERKGIYVQYLEECIREEEDWKKKAVLAAKLISLGLDS